MGRLESTLNPQNEFLVGHWCHWPCGIFQLLHTVISAPVDTMAIVTGLAQLIGGIADKLLVPGLGCLVGGVARVSKFPGEPDPIGIVDRSQAAVFTTSSRGQEQCGRLRH